MSLCGETRTSASGRREGGTDGWGRHTRGLVGPSRTHSYLSVVTGIVFRVSAVRVSLGRRGHRGQLPQSGGNVTTHTPPTPPSPAAPYRPVDDTGFAAAADVFGPSDLAPEPSPDELDVAAERIGDAVRSNVLTYDQGGFLLLLWATRSPIVWQSCAEAASGSKAWALEPVMDHTSLAIQGKLTVNRHDQVGSKRNGFSFHHPGRPSFAAWLRATSSQVAASRLPREEKKRAQEQLVDFTNGSTHERAEFAAAIRHDTDSCVAPPAVIDRDSVHDLAKWLTSSKRMEVSREAAGMAALALAYNIPALARPRLWEAREDMRLAVSRNQGVVRASLEAYADRLADGAGTVDVLTPLWAGQTSDSVETLLELPHPALHYFVSHALHPRPRPGRTLVQALRRAVIDAVPEGGAEWQRLAVKLVDHYLATEVAPVSDYDRHTAQPVRLDRQADSDRKARHFRVVAKQAGNFTRSLTGDNGVPTGEVARPPFGRSLVAVTDWLFDTAVQVGVFPACYLDVLHGRDWSELVAEVAAERAAAEGAGHRLPESSAILGSTNTATTGGASSHR